MGKVFPPSSGSSPLQELFKATKIGRTLGMKSGVKKDSSPFKKQK